MIFQATTLARLPLTMALLLLAIPACGQTDQQATYVASSRGSVYYWIGCDNWRDIPRANRRWFESGADAEAAGYRPSTARGCAGPEATAGDSPAQAGVCTVVRIVDGDTLACREAAERIRLLLIDAPELSEGAPALRSTDALKSLLPPGTVSRVELDVQERDRYGRILAYLYTPDGEMVNEAMARAGYAVTAVYPPNVRHIGRIRAAVEDARLASRGLWEAAQGCMPDGFTEAACP